MFKKSLLAAALATLTGPAFAAGSDLIVLDWAGWGTPDLIPDYTAKYDNAMPTFSFFADDDEAFQKMSAGFKADIGHPCSQMIQKYRDADLIQPWDVSKIPEFANINARFTHSKVFVDDKGAWFIPTDFGYTAIAWNTKEVPEADVSTLQVFLDPKYAGRISLPDNTDDVWALALLATGVTDWTNVTDDQFKAAADWLRKVHPNVRAYWKDPSELSQLMASGEVLVAWSWNDSIALLRSEGFPVGFQRAPKEGASSWFCGLVHFKNPPSTDEMAYDYVNAFTAKPTAKVLLSNFGYSSTNDTAMAEIPHDELVAASVDPVEGTMLSQTPLDQEMRNKMLEEFEQIKAGF